MITNSANQTVIFPGITIDAKSIAEGVYKDFDRNERVGVKFGMFPAAKMEKLEASMRQKAEELARQAAPELQAANPKFVDQFVSKAVHAVTVALMDCK